MKQALCLLAAATTLLGLAGCSIAIDGAAALPAGYTAAIASSRTVESPTDTTTSRPSSSTTASDPSEASGTSEASDTGAADPATPVETTEYTWRTAEAPEVTDMLVDAEVEDCFIDSAVIQSVLDEGFQISDVTRNVEPYTDGTVARYCSYDDSGLQMAFVNVFTPVYLTPAEYVHLDEQHALTGLNAEASYDQNQDVTTIFVASGENVIEIDIYVDAMSRTEITTVAAAALAGYQAA